jgi:hypothetical protein
MHARKLIPLTLVGIVAVCAVVAGITGARSEPSATTSELPTNDPLAASELRMAVERTLDASSFTLTSAIPHEGRSLSVFNAPNRYEVLNPITHQPVVILIGQYQYSGVSFGNTWARLKLPKPAVARSAALGPLLALSHVPSVQRLGPRFLASYVIPPSKFVRSSIDVTSTVRVVGGYVTEERIVADTNNPKFQPHTLLLRFTRFNKSLAVSAPLDTLISPNLCGSLPSQPSCPVPGSP